MAEQLELFDPPLGLGPEPAAERRGATTLQPAEGIAGDPLFEPAAAIAALAEEFREDDPGGLLDLFPAEEK